MPTRGFVRNGYLDWQRALHGADAPRPLEPIFVRLAGDDLSGSVRALIAVLDGDAPELFIAPQERARLDALRRALAMQDAAALDPGRGELFLYRPEARTAAEHHRFDALFEVIDIGHPAATGRVKFLISEASRDTVDPRPDPHPDRAPILAVIDDGVAFLNARFCRASGGRLRTRFRAVWVQGPPCRAARGVAVGRVLETAEIDAMLAAPGRDDRAVYGGLQGGDAALWRGTQLMDAAAGADPLDGTAAVQRWPLLAVHLGARDAEDPAGLAAEARVLMAVRWVLDRARELVTFGHHHPVVIALPQVGAGCAGLPEQVAQELERYSAATGADARALLATETPSRPVLDGALVADGALDALWQVAPDRQVAQYLAICAERPGDLRLSVSAPGGAVLPQTAMGAGEAQTLETLTGRAVARLYAVGAAERLVLAVAPTMPGEASAPAGRWRVRLTTGGAAQQVRLTAVTHGALSWGGEVPQGAAIDRIWPLPGAVSADDASLYTAAGSSHSVAGPTPSAVGEGGRARADALALGAGSVSGRILRGTSASAPRITRLMAQLADEGRAADTADIVAQAGAAPLGPPTPCRLTQS